MMNAVNCALGVAAKRPAGKAISSMDAFSPDKDLTKFADDGTTPPAKKSMFDFMPAWLDFKDPKVWVIGGVVVLGIGALLLSPKRNPPRRYRACRWSR